MLQFTNAIAKKFSINGQSSGSRAGVIAVAGDKCDVKLDVNNGHDPNAVSKAINSIHYTFGTADAYIGVHCAINMLDSHDPNYGQSPSRDTVPSLIVVVTRHVSPNSDVAKAGIRANLRGYAVVGLGIRVFQSWLTPLTTYESRAFVVNDYKDVNSQIEPMAGAIAKIGGIPKRCDASERLDVVFVVDESSARFSSVTHLVHSFIAGFAERLKMGTPDQQDSRLALVKYSRTCTTAIDWSYKKEHKVKQLIEAQRFEELGGRVTVGMKCGYDMFASKKNRASYPDVMVFMGDGFGDARQMQRLQAAAATKGVKTIAVDLFNSAFSSNLKYVTGDARRVYKPDTQALDKIFDDLCTDVDTPQGCCYNGGLALQCSCQNGYSGKYCEKPPNGAPPPPPHQRCIPKPVDIAFVVDGSGSITKANFDTTMRFLGTFTDSLYLDPSSIRTSNVGMVQFSSSARVEFLFGQYKTKAALRGRFLATNYMTGGTNVASGMNLAISSIFGNKNRRPDGHKRFMIVLTDGDDSSDVVSSRGRAEALGATVLAIGIGSGVKPDRLLQIAGDQKRVHQVADFDKLKKIIGTLCEDIGRSCCANGGEAMKCQCLSPFKQPYCLKK
jgi:uncharacterized protein YegL